jgi:hypothetical protein
MRLSVRKIGGSEDVIAEGAVAAVGGSGRVVEEGSEIFKTALGRHF